MLTQQLLALVSIVPVEIGEKPGLHGKVGVSLETKRGNTDKDNYKLDLRVDYDDNKSSHTWMEISGEYGESKSVKDTNKLYMHLRHIKALSSKDFCAETFIQAQDDEFKLIERRILGGGGVRFKLFELFNAGKGYLGLGALYENIQYTSQKPKDSDFRASSYFAYTIKLGSDSDLSYTLFYQPKISDLSDFVSSQKAALKLHIYRRLYLNFQIAYDLDNNPPDGVKKYDFTQTTSFIFDF